MKSRILLGSLATLLFLRQYITVSNPFQSIQDQLQFPYPYISQTGKISEHQVNNKYNFRKNAWLVSIKTPQIFSDKLDNLENNDLVLCETPQGDFRFKIVGAVSRNYTRFENGVSNYIPPGFVFLVDPVKKEIGMENIAVVSSKTHFSLGKWQQWQPWWSKTSVAKQQQLSSEPSFEREILQRNNVREQIKQSQLFQTNNNYHNDE